jgi:2-keto-4-pentenoate hydratase/2-oxohepta-3-ene-1,7-dioic acid hydratase in catechol pathway
VKLGRAACWLLFSVEEWEMKFVSFRFLERSYSGVLEGNRVLPLLDRESGKPVSLQGAIERGLCAATVGDFLDELRSVALDEIEVLPPIVHPGKIFCVGTNYENHRVETAREKATKPPLFLRTAETLVADGAPLLSPPESAMLDFEGEIAIIMGRPARRVPKEAALECVFGYSCFNDASVRDWQRHTHQWTPGKNFDATGGFGPFLVTKDEVGAPEDLHLTTTLNGRVVQDAYGHQMIFSIAEIIEYITTFTTLRAGDVIATGTPGGVGAFRDPPLFMKAGDRVEVEISRVGLLSNPIIAG